MRFSPALLSTAISAGITAAIPTTAGSDTPAPPFPAGYLPDPPANLSAPFVISEQVFPKNDSTKLARINDLFGAYVDDVKKNEPGVSVYEITYIDKKNIYLTYEVYDNFSIWESHLQTPYIAKLLEIASTEDLARQRDEIDVLREDFIYVRNEVGPVA